MHHFFKGLCYCIMSAVLSACSNVIPSIYHVDVPQGNLIKPSQWAKVKQGMPKQDVSYLLGTPMLRDVFHDNRWDYIYRIQQADTVDQHPAYTVFFKQGRVSSLRGPKH